MGYRDQLEAARARVSNLEAKVARLESAVTKHKHLAAQRAKGKVSSSALSLRQELGKLKKESRKRIDELEKQLSEKQREEDKWRKRCGQLEHELGGASLPSLIEHNRSRPELDIGGHDAPAHCPQCLQHGDRVELRHAPVPFTAELTTELEGVLCPRCAYFGLLRK